MQSLKKVGKILEDVGKEMDETIKKYLAEEKEIFRENPEKCIQMIKELEKPRVKVKREYTEKPGETPLKKEKEEYFSDIEKAYEWSKDVLTEMYDAEPEEIPAKVLKWDNTVKVKFRTTAGFKYQIEYNGVKEDVELPGGEIYNPELEK
ncbi:MAG: hypothetical protein MUP58_01135 [Candidatus Nanohaloarchaeota archaeon QJJ-9]|nr:hypothetical protein [Candidatus Nanohaloarchaeota archaeon QJJ-9]